MGQPASQLPRAPEGGACFLGAMRERAGRRLASGGEEEKREMRIPSRGRQLRKKEIRDWRSRVQGRAAAMYGTGGGT